mmetsp:Transcript_28964/g.44528  ORF Transcript_28964/g.44528 Transcript_28964/m.44528 type:complete len:224 (-) Transcript_28964:1224-1895(-)
MALTILVSKCQVLVAATNVMSRQPKRTASFISNNRFCSDRKAHKNHGYRDQSSFASPSATVPFFQQQHHIQPNIITHHSKLRSSTKLCYSRYDSLVAGIAEISLGTSIGVLYSEFAVITTGCGPLQLSDGLERFCYQAVIVFAGMSVFARIAFQKNLLSWAQDTFGESIEEPFTYYQVQWAEWLSLMSVFGAFVALGVQMYNGERLDGLSGIDVQMCRALREL